jgi:Zn finger protein HypA/HybF involved in hydrogenase expression
MPRLLHLVEPGKWGADLVDARIIQGNRLSMGTSLNAQCDCGFQANRLLIGYGMIGPDFCRFPILCKTCQNLRTANVRALPIDCPECHSQDVIPYDSDELKQSEGGQIVVSLNLGGCSERTIQLTNDGYLCPSCKQFTLLFEEGTLVGLAISTSK